MARGFRALVIFLAGVVLSAATIAAYGVASQSLNTAGDSAPAIAPPARVDPGRAGERNLAVDAYARVSPAVVNVTSSTLGRDLLGLPLEQEGTGSGFIIDQQGHIVTNHHVVAGATKLDITLPDESTYAPRPGRASCNSHRVVMEPSLPGGTLEVDRELTACGEAFMPSRILIVDDDSAVLNSLRRALVVEEYDVLVAPDGETALEIADSEALDLVVLDILLPGLDGLTVCQRLREQSSIPILMLTAKDTVPDRVAGLDRGADDYLVKPFALDEFQARVRALLRRSQQQDENLLIYSDVTVDVGARVALRAGQTLKLTPREYELLTVFVRHPRQALSRQQLCQQVWGYAFEGESNFVDVAVKDLRRKLEDTGRPRLIQTVRSYGYALREE